MADKRTTPEAAEGARRRKRAAPTIDLTATEVPGEPVVTPEPPAHEAHAEAPPAPPPMPDEPPQSVDEAPAPGPAGPPPPAGWFSIQMFAAGIAGGALVLVVLLVLWLTGMLPARETAVNGDGAQLAALQTQLRDLQNRPAGVVDTKSVDALGQRLSKIEDTIAKLSAGDKGVSERIAAADNALRALGVALAALNKRSDDATANAASARERAEAAEKAVSELRASVQDAARNAPGIAPAELTALQQRIASLEQSAKTAREEIAKSSASDTAARLSLSAAALRDAAVRGQPFSAELAQAKALGGDDKTLAPLAPFAANGVPTAQALALELRTLIPAMLKVSGAQAPEGGFIERLQANAGRLVRIRPVDAPSGDDASAVLARLEIAAAHADIAAALADLGKLNDATRAPAQVWIAKAKARDAALAAARTFAADTARALGPK